MCSVQWERHRDGSVIFLVFGLDVVTQGEVSPLPKADLLDFLRGLRSQYPKVVC